MTPNPESPIFKQNYISEYACENAKKLGEVYTQIKNDAKHGKWNGITNNDITLEYNTYDGSTRVEAKLIDNNKHTHHFIIQLLPDNGFGDGTDYLCLRYLFEGEFDRNVLSVRSFAEYLSVYLEWEGLEPRLTNCDKGIEMPGHINHLYDEFCMLLDITLSKLKPTEWFYSKEIQVDSFIEVQAYFSKVLSLLKSEAEKGKWRGISPECFSQNNYVGDDECAILLKYRTDDVWEWLIHMDAAWCENYADLSCGVSCYPYHMLSQVMQKKLDTLFKEFLESLPSAKGNMYIGCGHGEHILNIQYFHIEDSFELFCNVLDEITIGLKCFNLQMPEPSITLTEEMEIMKKQLEESLHTTLSIVTDEGEINRKLKYGYFEK